MPRPIDENIRIWKRTEYQRWLKHQRQMEVHRLVKVLIQLLVKKGMRDDEIKKTLQECGTGQDSGEAFMEGEYYFAWFKIN